MAKLEELNAKAAALKKEMAEHEEPIFAKALALLEKLESYPEFEELAALAPELPDSDGKRAIANVGAALSSTKAVVSLGLVNIRVVIEPLPPRDQDAPAMPASEILARRAAGASFAKA